MASIVRSFLAYASSPQKAAPATVRTLRQATGRRSSYRSVLMTQDGTICRPAAVFCFVRLRSLRRTRRLVADRHCEEDTRIVECVAAIVERTSRHLTQNSTVEVDRDEVSHRRLGPTKQCLYGCAQI